MAEDFLYPDETFDQTYGRIYAPGNMQHNLAGRLGDFVRRQAQLIEQLQNELRDAKAEAKAALTAEQTDRLKDRQALLQLQIDVKRGNIQKTINAASAMQKGMPPKEAIVESFGGKVPSELGGREEGPLTQEEYENQLFTPTQEIPFGELEKAAYERNEKAAEERRAKREIEQLRFDKQYRENKIKELSEKKAKYTGDLAREGVPEEGHDFTSAEEQELIQLQYIDNVAKLTEEQRKQQGDVSVDTLESAGPDTMPNMPPYLVGKEGALHKLIKRAYRETIAERPYFIGERIAEFQPLQQEAEREAFRAIQAPELKYLFGESAKGLKKAASTTAYDDVAKYLNPSLAPLLDLMEKRTKRDFEERILPPINAHYIAKGAYRGGARQRAIEKAQARQDELIADQRTQMLGSAYDTALGASTEDMKRRAINAAQLQDLKAQEHEGRIKNVHLLDEIGKRKQAFEQEKLNQEYRDWLEQNESSMRATERFAELVRGLPSQTKIYDRPPEYTPRQQNPSLQSALGGTLLSLAGQNAGMGGLFPTNKRAGGRVKKAAGGIMSDYDSRLKGHIDRLDTDGRHPLWDFLENFGMGVASSKSPTVKGAIQEGLPIGLMGSKQAILDREARREKALSLSGLLEKSRMDREMHESDRSLKAAETKYKLAQAGELSNPGPTDSVMTTETTGPFVVTKKGNRVTHIGGKPVVGGVIQEGAEPSEGGELSFPSTPIPKSGIGPRKGTFLENKLDTQAQAERDKKETDLMTTINDGYAIIQGAKELSKDLPNPAYHGIVKKFGTVKNLVGEELPALSKLETYEGTISETLGPLLQKLRGLGSMSEMEFNAATGLLAKADKQPTTRENLLTILEASMERSQAQINARNAYKEKFGSDQGFDRVWMNYVTTHPAFSYNQEIGKYEVNKDNLKNWTSIFEPKQSSKQSSRELSYQPAGNGKVKVKAGDIVGEITREELERIANGKQ